MQCNARSGAVSGVYDVMVRMLQLEVQLTLISTAISETAQLCSALLCSHLRSESMPARTQRCGCASWPSQDAGTVR
jgi:hypothetical protein